MLYLNDRGAHIGDEASHGAMRRQVLPRDRSGGPLARGGSTRETAPISLLEESSSKPRLLGSHLSEAGIEGGSMGRIDVLTGSQGRFWGG